MSPGRYKTYQHAALYDFCGQVCCPVVEYLNRRKLDYSDSVTWDSFFESPNGIVLIILTGDIHNFR